MTARPHSWRIRSLIWGRRSVPIRARPCRIVSVTVRDEDGGVNELQPELLAWSALLGRWIDLVKAGHGMPEIGDGRKWQASVTSIIELQATTFALDDLETLTEADRPLARDRGCLLIENARDRLEEAWDGDDGIPEEIELILAAADTALNASFYAGLTVLWWEGPGTWVVPQVEPPGNQGTLAMMQPGTIVLPGEPVGWYTERAAPALGAGLVSRAGAPLQVQRVIEDGRVRCDLLVDLDHEMVGVPLLVPIALAGRGVGNFTVDAEAWRAAQEAAFQAGDPPPVCDLRGE